jgi:hypothetical protein
MISETVAATSHLRRTPLGNALREGVPEPEELEPEILLKGKAHQIFAPPTSAKTWVAVWLITRVLERGHSVMFLDIENGKRIISERLQGLEVSADDVDRHLYYYDFPTLGISPDDTAAYRNEMDEVKPDLIIFDSWIGFLAAAGLDENSPTNVEEWASEYVLPVKARGSTVIILDHVPHDANRSRGATRKKDVVDVQWSPKKVQDFDRSSVGYVQLTREKDREAWLPQRVGFSVGGTEEGFIMERSEGTVAAPGDELPPSARAALDALDSFGFEGAMYTQWRKAIVWNGTPEMGDSTFRNAKNRLVRDKRVRQDNNRYYSNNRSAAAVAVDALGHTPQHSTAAALGAEVPAEDDGKRGDERLIREAFGEMDEAE